MADIGSLVVKLAAETAEFQADLGRTTRMLEHQSQQMQASMQRLANFAKGAFAAAIGVVSVQAVRDFTMQALEATAAINELAEKTGASVEALSGFAPVATISGQSLEDISGSLTKLAKGLAGADEETAGASRALKFLGVSALDASRNLRDPAEVMNDIALKLDQFADGAGKTAIAMELFGKSGATMLPFLKDLAENQDLNIRLTRSQIAEADAATKSFDRMRAEMSFVSQTIVVSSVSAFKILGQEFSRVTLGTTDLAAGIGKLRDDGTLARWAETSATALATLADAVRALVQGIRAVFGSFEAVWADVQLVGTFIGNGGVPGLIFKENRERLAAALDERNKIVQQSNQNYADLWNMPLLADAVAKRFKEARELAAAGLVAPAEPAKPQLNFSPVVDKSNLDRLAAIQNEVKGLQRLIDEEGSLLRDRQKMLELYESSGYLGFQQSSARRLAAQQEFIDKSRSLYAEQEMLLQISLKADAKTAQEKLKLQDQLAELDARRQRLERDSMQSNLERMVRLPAEIIKDLQEQAARGQNELRAAEERIRVLRESGVINEVSSLDRLARARAESALQLQALADQAREVADAAMGNDRLADSFEKIAEAARRAADDASLLRQRALELVDPQTGAVKGLRLFAEEAAQLGRQMENVMRRAFGGMTDALTDFVTSGKLDFRSLTQSIIADLIRIQIQSAITAPLARALGAAFPFANGGVMTASGPVPLRAYASGGIASSPQLALFGEGSRPEAFVPLPDGRSIPVTLSGGASNQVIVNVNVESGHTSVMGQGEAAAMAHGVAALVRSELIRQKRNGGLLAAA